MYYHDDGYTWPCEQTDYDLVRYQDSVSFSDYECYDLDTYDAYTVPESHEPRFLDQYHRSDDYDYSYSFAHPTINNFAYNSIEPKLIVYEPIACDTGYVSYHAYRSVSFATTLAEFNEPEFEEYDATPYGGGYDIVSHYGKPLPPSDETCYPRSTIKSILREPKPKPIPMTPLEPTPRPVLSEPEPEVEPRLRPRLEPMFVPTPSTEPEPKPMSQLEPTPRPGLSDPEPKVEPRPRPKLEPMFVPTPSTGPEPMHDPHLVAQAEPLELGNVRERENEEYRYPGYGYDYPWREYDQGYGIGVGYDYGSYGKQMVQVPPCEYNQEVVEFCENIFGDLPCLAKIKKQQMGNASNQGVASNQGNRQYNPWERCADFIFGGPNASYNQYG